MQDGRGQCRLRSSTSDKSLGRPYGNVLYGLGIAPKHGRPTRLRRRGHVSLAGNLRWRAKFRRTSVKYKCPRRSRSKGAAERWFCGLIVQVVQEQTPPHLLCRDSFCSGKNCSRSRRHTLAHAVKKRRYSSLLHDYGGSKWLRRDARP